MLHWCNEVVAGVSRVWRVSRDVTLRHTRQDVESYLINTVSAADGLIVTLLISIVAELCISHISIMECRKYTSVLCENHIHISLIKWYILRTFSFNAHWTSSVVQAYYIYGVSPGDLSSGSVSWLTAPARCWRACAELACANTLAGDTGAAAAHKFSSSVSTRGIHEISQYFLNI